MRGEVRPASLADMEPVCRLLHEQMSARLSPDGWQRLMTYRWLEKKPDFGRVAIADGRVVGFVGAIYADRTFGSRHCRTANICAWYLEKAYRKAGFGFELMRSATEDDSLTYTIFTSSARSVSLLAAVGYRVLEDERRLWMAKGESRGIRVIQDRALVLSRVGRSVRDMLLDHEGLPILTAFVADGDGDCLIVLSIAKKGDDVTYFDVLHLSDPAFFTPRAQATADALLPPSEKAVLAVDRRLLRGHASDGMVERLAVPRYYKSHLLEPADIDCMYSELQLLNLKLD